MRSDQQSAPHLTAAWAGIDSAYCISLMDRKDRRESARKQFARAGLADRVEFFLAQRHPSDSEQGIFESHQTCLQKGLDAGARTILVFEDDVLFGRIDARRLQAALDFFDRSPNEPILFLGCLVDGSRATAMAGVRRVRYRCMGHAYVVKAELAKVLAHDPWKQIPFDTLLRQMVTEPLALYPAIAFQSDVASDNDRQRTLEIIRRFLGGMRLIQTANQHFHRFRSAVIGAHIIVIAALILWLINR